jgi:hypothetical protein
MKISIAFLAVAAIAAAPAMAVGVPNDANARLLKLSTTEQRATLRRAVLDHDLKCDHIGPVAYQGPYKNLEMWVVKCDKGDVYGAFVGPDGSVQVRSCADIASFKLPTCRVPK